MISILDKQIISRHDSNSNLNDRDDAVDERGSIRRQSSILSSAGKMKMCHVCGNDFPKSSITLHQRGCIRKSLCSGSSSANARISFSAGNGNGGVGSSATHHECGKCFQNIPFLLFSSHFKTCDHLSLNQRVPATAATPSLVKRSVSNPIPNSAAAGYSSKANLFQISSNSSIQDLRGFLDSNRSPQQDHPQSNRNSNIQEFSSSTRPPSRASVVSLSAKKKQTIPNHATDSPIHLVSRKNSSVESPSVYRKASSHSLMTDATSSSVAPSRTAPSPQLQLPVQKQEHVQEQQSHRAQKQVKEVPHPMFHENDREERLDVSEYLIPCSICGRKFMQDRLDKHRDVCSKTKQKVRKPFDVRAARVQGTEMEKYVLKKQSSSVHEEEIKPKKSNWRTKHEAFRQMVVSARQPVQRGPTGSIIAAAPTPPNPDYITCPCCERRFNEDSGKRHIPICKEKAAKKALERPTASRGKAAVSAGKDKMEELKRRTAYKPPTPKLKKRV